jgi:hypothetical protein
MDTNERICCVCGHPLDAHFDEKRPGDNIIPGWWRCHSLARDGYQCECRLLQWNEESKIEEYDVDVRREQLLEEEFPGREKTKDFMRRILKGEDPGEMPSR